MLSEIPTLSWQHVFYTITPSMHQDTVIVDMVNDVRMLHVGAFGGVADDESKRIGDAKRRQISDMF